MGNATAPTVGHPTLTKGSSMRELTLSQFTTSLANSLSAMSAQIARVLEFTGNIEAWLVVQYLLSYSDSELKSLDYWREFPPPREGGGRKRKRSAIDLAFNVMTANPNNPPILAEWKCSLDANDLVTGFFRDQDKFSEVLVPYPKTIAKPYPVLVGIAPQAEGEMGPGIDYTNLQNGIGLYLSTKSTWITRGLVQYTAYSAGQGIPEQAMMANTLTASGQRSFP